MTQGDSYIPDFTRHTRYQGAIVRDHAVLLIKEIERSTGRSFWFFPGGGMEAGETEEECVRREMKEETGLDVRGRGLLLDGPELHRWSPYRRHLTYLCEPLEGAAVVSTEHEEGRFAIVDWAWVDLRDEALWPPEVFRDEATRHLLRLVRHKLGYMPQVRLNSETRYQGATVRDDQILLVRHREDVSGRTYWIFPGGGLEGGETEEQCVRREILEETNLEVRVVRLLLEEVADGRIRRPWMKTYLCEAVRGTPRPGAEPEGFNSIVGARWFDLRNEAVWGEELVSDVFTYSLLERVRKKLGYIS